MSGGAYDYVHWKIEEFANNLGKPVYNPKRVAFSQLLLLVAQAAHDIDYVDSGDYGPGDENAAIDRVFAFLGNHPEIIKKAGAYDELKDRLLTYFNENK